MCKPLQSEVLQGSTFDYVITDLRMFGPAMTASS